MHKATSFIVAALSTLALIGCGPGNNNVDVYRIQIGAATIVQPGTQAGYGITANTGSTFRLVWVGDSSTSGTYRQFTGSVSTTGTFTQVAPSCAGNVCSLEGGDVISAPVAASGGGQRIDFNTIATDDIDGFDFTVSQEPVYFDLFIDNQRYPNLIFFPAADNNGAISNAGEIPFGLVTQ